MENSEESATAPHDPQPVPPAPLLASSFNVDFGMARCLVRSQVRLPFYEAVIRLLGCREGLNSGTFVVRCLGKERCMRHAGGLFNRPSVHNVDLAKIDGLRYTKPQVRYFQGSNHDVEVWSFFSNRVTGSSECVGFP
ncbi:hypothetical protein GOBAR_AA38421 [Gossypium barbadense]|uniref:Uncharacterized protein n=1 Tax=Gossypium barbadense TaxID=3634 RepID=A0A2P5VTZ0_GOSBA|nr:hypothetical protein GOBAR_AA38421 [Gossypium barbadense]